jgi:hypothetical protein
MANRILMATGWESRIRSKLGVDAAYLSDEDCQQPDVVLVAEASIIEQVEDYATLIDDDKTWLEAATVCECAALLCPSMKVRIPAIEQGPHFKQELTVDWDKKRQELEAERDRFVAKINGEVTVPRFGLAGPGR